MIFIKGNALQQPKNLLIVIKNPSEKKKKHPGALGNTLMNDETEKTEDKVLTKKTVPNYFIHNSTLIEMPVCKVESMQNHKLFCYLAQPTTPDMMLQMCWCSRTFTKAQIPHTVWRIGVQFEARCKKVTQMQKKKTQNQTQETPRTIRNASSILLKFSTIN